MTSDININAYAHLLVTDEPSKITIGADINYRTERLRDAFKRADAGERVVTPALNDELIGKETGLIQSDPYNSTNYKDLTNSVLELARKKFLIGTLSSEEESDLQKAFENLRMQTGVPRGILNVLINEGNARLTNEEKNLSGVLYPSKNPDVQKAIELLEDVTKKYIRGKEPDAEEFKKLKDAVGPVLEKEGFTEDQLVELLTEYEKKVGFHDDKNKFLYDDFFNENLYYVTTAWGMAAFDDKDKPYVILPDRYRDQQNKSTTFGFFEYDPPPIVFPGTRELLELAVNIHEAEHLTKTAKVPVNSSKAVNDLAHEIDADLAVLQALDMEGKTDAKEYWLRARHIESFLTYSYYRGHDALDHNTATFLRIYDKTGQQIDLEKYMEEKRDLLERVYQKSYDNMNKTVLAMEATGLTINGKINYPTTAAVMQSVRDVLKDDQALRAEIEQSPETCTTDERLNFLLTPAQIAEAQSFLEDAQALGYKDDSRADVFKPVDKFDPKYSIKIPINFKP